MERKEAIEVIKKNLPDSRFTMLREALETLIPEFKESKDEKKLKESLMRYLWDMYHKDFCPPKPSIELCDKWIAWLEKQGDQKPTDEEMKTLLQTEYEKGRADVIAEMQNHADKDEPMFKVGDWVVYGYDHLYQVKEIDYCPIPRYELESIYGDKLSIPITWNCKLRNWTVQDAKDGDVLSWNDSNCIVLFKSIHDEDTFNGYGFISHCTGKFESWEFYTGLKGAHPATKWERDLLFQKMKEAGYEWDAGAKTLTEVAN